MTKSPVITRIANIKKHEPYDVYAGRSPRNKPRNPLANCYSIGVDGTREEVIRKFAYDFRLHWSTDPAFKEAVLACHGKILGCFCSPLPCHAKVIALFVDAFHEYGETAGFSAIDDYVSTFD